MASPLSARVGRRAFAFVEHRDEQRAAAMQARAHRAERTSEHGGRLRVGQLLQLAQDECLPILDGQARDGGVQALHALVGEQPLVAADRCSFVRQLVGPAAFEAQSIEGHVTSTAEQPCAHGAFGTVEPTGVFEHVQKHLLRHVLREAARLGHRKREPIHVVVTASIELDERVFTSRRNLGEQPHLGAVVGSR